jgi:P27 family predicted phage terminase small subunit
MPKELPECPKNLNKAAKRLWNRTLADLSEVGMLSRVDGPALANYCRAQSFVERFYKDALEEPYDYEAQFDKEGNVIGRKKKLGVAFLAYDKASKMQTRIGSEFGLTPSSRSRIHIEKPKPADEFPTREQSAANDAEKESADLLASIDEKVAVN